MGPPSEKTRLKRGLPGSVDAPDFDNSKKPRRSERTKHVGGDTPLKGGDLPSPLTTDNQSDDYKAGAVTPPSQKPVASHFLSPPRNYYSSSQRDTQQTQPFSQFLTPSAAYQVDDEEEQGVWGYLVPQEADIGAPLVLRRRDACPLPENATKIDGKASVPKDEYTKQEDRYERKKEKQTPAGGYLVGRHPECDRKITSPTVSNRHFLIYNESKVGHSVAVLEDLSANGTYVNFNELGRNKRVHLHDGDVIDIGDDIRWTFRYPKNRSASRFREKFEIQHQLGKGHFASVYLCVDRLSGTRYAVKKFERRQGPGEKSRTEGLQQEIAVLKGISHPALLCMHDSYDEDDGVYLVVELAPEGELFNWIVMKQKLVESEARKLFVQLFQAVKYLHERNIVHRDIKPENILLVDRDLTIKVADFGLAKIIGEESFTTTLCGTPSYVAPEILQSSNHRRYTRAVDVWSLGVVLYICLCGFPPFSDELYSPQNPYTLAQQILGGRFDYPSPYWDSVGDPALDLIDKMLTVDPDKRITIDECLEHPWTTNTAMEPTQMSHDSTDSLRGALEQLDFSHRKPVRERTLLSSLNEVHVSRIIELEPDNHGHPQPAVKIFEKNKNNPVTPKQQQKLAIPPNDDNNANGQLLTPGTTATGGDHSTVPKSPAGSAKAQNGKNGVANKQLRPADERKPEEFMQMGGKGDQPLFGDDGQSRYISPEANERVNGGAK